MDLLSLGSVAGGALQEKANAAMKKVLDNLLDPNTPWKNKRQITIRLGFSQNETRDDMSVDVAVETKLAPAAPVGTRMAIGKDIRSGNVFAEEYGRQIKGQRTLDDYMSEKAAGSGIADAATGEAVENVTDFRKKEA